MNLVIAVKKAVQRVRSHLREGRPVQGYVRRTKEAARELFESHYAAIDGWVWQSIRRLQRLGSRIESPDDGYMAAMEASLIALQKYSPARGSLEHYVRRAIKFALSRYLAEERSHGLTGVRTLYDRLRVAATAETREKVLQEFPRLEPVVETHPAPSVESEIEGTEGLLKRDSFLEDIEKELGLSLERIREHLNQREKKTWKKKNLANRKLNVYLLRVEGLSFREIAKRLRVDAGDAYRAHKEIAGLVQEAHEKALGIKKTVDIERLRNWRLRRLLFGLERLRVGMREGFPPQHLRFIRNVVIGILADLTDDQEPADAPKF